MTEPHKKLGLLRMTDKQLQEGYERSLEHVLFSPNHYYGKIQRRSQDRHSRVIRRPTWAIAFLAFIETIATVLGLLSKF